MLGSGAPDSSKFGTWASLSVAIATRVKQALETRSMMQKELASLAGIRPQQLSRILKGKVNLTLRTITRLEEVLDIKLLEVPVGDSRKHDDQNNATMRGLKSIRSVRSRRVKAWRRRGAD